MKQRLGKYFGTRAFYRMVIALIIPMIVQQGVTSFVNLLDNIMVGALGTAAMSGVAIANQLFFVYNMIIFGGMSAASIFGAQYFGSGDYEGMRCTTRIKLIFGLLTTVVVTLIFVYAGKDLALLFLDNQANSGVDTAYILDVTLSYIRIILWGLPPFFIVQCYSGTLRECGETVISMIASVCAIVVNLVFNWLLIFGKLGFPELGVNGAAIATVLARYVELAIILIYTHVKAKKFPFVPGLYRNFFRIPASLVGRVVVKGWPLLINEALWSFGTTFINRYYSTHGLSVVAALNIQSTAWQLFSIIMMASGNAVSILVGQKLGAGEIEEAKDVDRKLLCFTVLSHIGIGAIAIALSGLVPRMYNTEQDVRDLAQWFLIVMGMTLPIHSYIHGAYFTIRSGGRTFVTMLFDSVYTWCIPVLLSWLLCSYTSLSIFAIYFIVQFSDLIKVGIAIPMLRSGFWAKNIISGIDSKPNQA